MAGEGPPVARDAWNNHAAVPVRADGDAARDADDDDEISLDLLIGLETEAPECEDVDEAATAEEERKREDLHPVTLQYRDPAVELEYRRSRFEQVRLIYRVILSVLAACFFLFFIIMVLGFFGTENTGDKYQHYWGMPLAIALFSLTVLVLFELSPTVRTYWLTYHEYFAMAYGTLLILQSVVVLALVHEGSFSPTMWMIVQGVVVVIEGVVVSTYLFVAMFVAIAAQHALAFYMPGPSTIMILLPLCAAFAFALMAVYVMELSLRRVWAFRLRVEARSKSLGAERAQLETLAKLQLPETVIARLQQHGTEERQTSLQGHSEAMAQRVPLVTVVFVELYGWDKTVQAQDPDAAITLLNTIFTWMDALAAQHGLEKIKTIGSVYLAACNVPEPKADHTESVAHFALELVHEWKGESARQGLAQLDLRIGISRGEVVAGIVGDLKFCYDIYGDTVNTASRMCKFSKPNHIQCTAEVANTLRASAGGFTLASAGSQEIKGKGVMETFHVLGDSAHPIEKAMPAVGKWAVLRNKIATEKVSRLGKLLGGGGGGGDGAPPAAPAPPKAAARVSDARTAAHVPLPGEADPESLLALQEAEFGAAPMVDSGRAAMPPRRQRRMSVVNGINASTLRKAVARRTSVAMARMAVAESKSSLASSSASSIGNIPTLANAASVASMVRSHGANGAEERPSLVFGIPLLAMAELQASFAPSSSNLPVRSTAALTADGPSPFSPPSPRMGEALLPAPSTGLLGGTHSTAMLHSASSDGVAVLEKQPSQNSKVVRGSVAHGLASQGPQMSRASLIGSRGAATPGGDAGGQVVIRRKDALASALGAAGGTAAERLRQLQSTARHRVTLRFADASLERTFVLQYATTKRRELLWFLLCCGAFSFVLVTCDYISDATPERKRTIALIRFVGSAVVCGVPAALVLSAPRVMRHSQKLSAVLWVALVTLNYVAMLLNPALSNDWAEGENFYGPNTTDLLLNTIAMALPGLLLRHAIALLVLHAIAFLVIYAASGAKLYLFDLAFCAVSLFLVFLSRYIFEKFAREHFILVEVARVQQAELEHEKTMGEHLVHNILPPSIARLLAVDPNCKTARYFPSVTVLAMDIAGFTAMSSTMTAENVVAMLNDLFCRFDALVLAIGVEKICTIGDAYIAACGAPEECADHQDRVLLLAMGMLRAIEDRNAEIAGTAMPRVTVRIGVHTGDCFGGVMGGQVRFKYDLYGRAMAIAQVLEQTGTPTCAHVSYAALGSSALVDPAIAEISGVEQVASAPVTAGFAGTEETLETFLLRPVIEGAAPMSSLKPNVAHH